MKFEINKKIISFKPNVISLYKNLYNHSWALVWISSGLHNFSTFLNTLTSMQIIIRILETLSFLIHLVHWKAYAIICWQMWKEILGYPRISFHICQQIIAYAFQWTKWIKKLSVSKILIMICMEVRVFRNVEKLCNPEEIQTNAHEWL